MNFLVPAEDAFVEICQKNQDLSINKNRVVIGYREAYWINDSPIKEQIISQYQTLLKDDENISYDNIVYIKYVNIFLWHKSDRIDRISGSGNTKKDEKWQNIKNEYLDYLKDDDADANDNNDDEKNTESAAAAKSGIKLNVNKKYQELPKQRKNRRYYYYYYNSYNRASEIIENGFYEIENKNNPNKNIKISVEKYLKKSYKKTKLYHEQETFKFLTPKQLDNVYRNYEHTNININNETAINSIYRLNLDKNKSHKKLCILNVLNGDGGSSGSFDTDSTLHHSVSRYIDKFNEYENENNESTKYLYHSNIIYSPNVVIFNDKDGNLTSNYFKVSFITALPVNCTEYYKIQRALFKTQNEEKDNNGADKKKKKRKHKKNKKEQQQETDEYIAKLAEMKEAIQNMMRNRIRKIIEIALINGVDTLIFDAFGCNEEFGNDIKEIADIFAELIQSIYYKCFKSVYFTIPERSDKKNNRQNNKHGKKDKKSIKSKIDLFQNAFENKFV